MLKQIYELYQIDNRALQCVDEETGEILSQEELDKLGMKKDEIIESLGHLYRFQKLRERVCEEERENLKNKLITSKIQQEQIKSQLYHYLKGEKYITPVMSISFRKSSSVEVEDISKLEQDYLSYPTPKPTPDKNKIKKAIQSGIPINGVRLAENINISIK